MQCKPIRSGVLNMRWPEQAVRCSMESPLGRIELCATARGLAGLWFHDQRHLPDSERFAMWPTAPEHPVLLAVQSQLARYFKGETTGFDLPLDLTHGTEFQAAVWRSLLDIPAGVTCSYGDIAQSMHRPNAARAVGAAVGRNPISIVVPCHRVLGAGGALTGYAGGLDRKIALLRLEHAMP
jgi:methylated-DNA-[protein]-cysteine S-methyltransferase